MIQTHKNCQLFSTKMPANERRMATIRSKIKQK